MRCKCIVSIALALGCYRVGIWQLAKKVSLSSNQSDVKIEFTVPITACNLMIEYSDFYENNQVHRLIIDSPILGECLLNWPLCYQFTVTDYHDWFANN